MSIKDNKNNPVSITVLAKSIGIGRNELFELLREQNFIKKVNDKWVLKELGKKVGGVYKYRNNGRYIVWPLNILQHPSFSGFKVIPHIAENNLFGTSMDQEKYNDSAIIPAYSSIDVDFPDVKNEIDDFLEKFIAQSIVLSTDEVTKFITRIVSQIGEKLNFQIEKEPLYNITDLVDASWVGARGDIAWCKNGNRVVMWEIDSTNKPHSIIKLMSSPAKYNVWLPWVQYVNRFRVNCLLHAPTCQVIRPRQKTISAIWSKLNKPQGV